MYGDKWWGYLHDNGVVTIAPQDWQHNRAYLNARCAGVPVNKIVGPFAEDWADEFEGDIKMVRRKIMSALYEKPLEELLDEP